MVKSRAQGDSRQAVPAALRAAYADLLRDTGSPFLHTRKVVGFSRQWVRAGLAAGMLLELHESLCESTGTPQDREADGVLAAALSYRTLHLQLDRARHDLAKQERTAADALRFYRSKASVLAMVTHDLTNYVATTRILVRTVLRDDRSPAIQDRLQHVLSLLEEEERLITNLLATERTEAGFTAVPPVAADLSIIVERCVKSARCMSKHRFVVVLEPMLVTGDAHKIRQILENLVGNAVKYSPDGSQVEIVTHRQGERAVVEVRDEGRGMSPDAVLRIFEPYYRIQDSGQNPVPGTGLGLSIVKSMLDSLGGDVEVDTHLGEGTVVRVTLPLVEPPGRPRRSYAG